MKKRHSELAKYTSCYESDGLNQATDCAPSQSYRGGEENAMTGMRSGMSSLLNAVLVTVAMLFVMAGFVTTADAAVTLLDGYTTAPQIASNTSTSATATYTPSGTSADKRVVVVHVAAHTNGTTATTITTDIGNGSTWTSGRLVGYSANNQRRQNWIFYFNEADLAASSGK